jgi:predicted nuclease of predicted toxin-antitoxin system
MKPLGFPLLTDENIRSEVVDALRAQGKDIVSVHDEKLTGQPDVAILRRARELGRVMLTHDSDFGQLAVQAGEPIVGIIYLRPGHIAPAFVLQTIAAIESRGDEVEPPFILVAERRQDVVRVRVRRVGH